ncbi:zf-HC2 domain-containing protein [Solihabitans fulvus]|uniref:Zf-HC2 domain-containing protein n=1 Tax=Solihabitans fulvus TaxID=1892852 RepID=A0A5B2WNP3_9PSEU|nr:zf-HC2 domain-containing protein [Solihabitans fulvus]KAA2253613.1 zf-HC2 domain-containing protein [Solihabitans fulvus]
MSCLHTVSLGAYLLGALEPGERAAFERHLDGCPICRDELVRLAPLPGLLGQLTLDDLDDADVAPSPVTLPTALLTALPVVLPAEPPAEPTSGPSAQLPTELPSTPRPALSADRPSDAAPDLPSSPPAAESQADLPVSPLPAGPGRLRRRWVLVAAGFVVLLAAVGLLVPRLFDADQSPAPASAMWTASDQGSGVAAAAQLQGRPWGTEVQLQLDHLPAGVRCQLILYTADGRAEIGGWWGSTYSGGERVPGASSFALDQIDRMEIRTADHQTLVTLRRPG